MKQCPACKRTYDDSTMFCKECGVALGAAVNTANVKPAPYSTQAPGNEYKKWTLNGTFLALGLFEGRKETIIKANGPIMQIEQHKKFIIQYGERHATVDARDITDVHVKKKTATPGIILMLMGVFFLLAPFLGAVLMDEKMTASDFTAGLVPGLLGLLVGYFGFTNKHYIVTHRKGSFNLPFKGLDSAQRQDFLDYITKYSPYAVKDDLSMGW